MNAVESVRSAARSVVSWPDWQLEGRRGQAFVDALKARGWSFTEQLTLEDASPQRPVVTAGEVL